MSWKVLILPDSRGDQHFVLSADPHQPLVKRPVTKATQGQAVLRLIVMAPAPWYDVGSLNNGMTFRGQHSDSA